jgi:hypothetical protein
LKIIKNLERRNEVIEIPHSIINVGSAKLVSISFPNFLNAIMKMKTRQAVKIRMFWVEFMNMKMQYSEQLFFDHFIDVALMNRYSFEVIPDENIDAIIRCSRK